MNKYLRAFLHRGLVFGGFGPIVTAIIFLILNYSIEDLSFDGKDMFLAVISTYILAFLQAGASVFNQIESWSIAKSLLCHFSVLFSAYSVCYIVNSWIPFEPIILLIFSLVFTLTYFAIWFTVYFIVRVTSKKLNEDLKS